MDDLKKRVDQWLASQLPPANSTASIFVDPFAEQLIKDMDVEIERLRKEIQSAGARWKNDIPDPID